MIANNGIAAVKEIRSIRKWAYETFGNERAIEFTVMATPEDIKANAEYIRMADRYLEVPGGANHNNYANVELIVELAEQTDVDAVWAGWGHASENPRLPESLASAISADRPEGIEFIGPPGWAMRALGDKISSTIIAQSAGVPTLPWNGSDIFVDLNEDLDKLFSDEVYQRGCVKNAEEALEIVTRIGFPVMIKASEGGGGKGIRKVYDTCELPGLFRQVESEVKGSPIFIMKLAGKSRHLEVQIIADKHGNAISLFGRDCSVQRRHQKIIEEAPATIAPLATFEKMERSAVRLAKLLGYVSAGTVEYLYSEEEDKFYFLELNPRLQVEHPTTEIVTGVNIPALQLQIAMGIPLHRVRDIRLLYGLNPVGIHEIDFHFSRPESYQIQRQPQTKGHVIACRITAENPDQGFRPNNGKMQELNFRSSANVWGYFSVAGHGGIHEYADSQIGHVFSYGESRQQARKNLIIALKELSIRGDFRTTTEYLIKLLETEAFQKNSIDTGWLDSLIAEKITTEKPDRFICIISGAVHKASQFFESNIEEFGKLLYKGIVPGREYLKTETFVEIVYENIKYNFAITQNGPEDLVLFLNGSSVELSYRKLSDSGLLISLDAKSHLTYMTDDVTSTRLVIDGMTCVLEHENDPTKLRSPSPGKLVRLPIEDGGHVNKGEPFAEIEVMKMYMALTAAESGTIHILKQIGSLLQVNDIIAILTLDDPTKVRYPSVYEGLLPKMGPPNMRSTKTHLIFRRLRRDIDLILEGYHTQSRLDELVQQLFKLIRSIDLPLSELQEILSILNGRLPGSLEKDIKDALSIGKRGDITILMSHLKSLIDAQMISFESNPDLLSLKKNIQPLSELIEQYGKDPKNFEISVISSILESFLRVETLFSHEMKRADQVLLELRDFNKEDLRKLVAVAMSHSKAATKAILIQEILGHIDAQHLEPEYTGLLKRISRLNGKHYPKLILKAREILIHSTVPSFEQRSAEMEKTLELAVMAKSDPKNVGPTDPTGQFNSKTPLHSLIDSNDAVYDVLPQFVYHADRLIRLAALEVYVRRAYRAYELFSVHTCYVSDIPVLQWEFGKKTTFTSSAASEILISQESPSSPGNSLSHFAMAPKGSRYRVGLIAGFKSMKELQAEFVPILERIPYRKNEISEGKIHVNVMNVTLSLPGSSEPEIIILLNEFVDHHKTMLRSRCIKRLTFMILKEKQFPYYFTFSERVEFAEQIDIRHMEPALAFQFELYRLSNFNIRSCPTENRSIHVYHATGKQRATDCRFFIRTLVRQGNIDHDNREASADYLISEADKMLGESLNALEILETQHPDTDCNHFFVNLIPVLNVSQDQVHKAINGFLDRHGKRLFRLRITGAEIRLIFSLSSSIEPLPIRVIVTNVSGFVVHVHLYAERLNEKGQLVLVSVGGERGPLDQTPVDAPYPNKEWLQPRRHSAHLNGTTYVYDFPDLFRQALQKLWNEYSVLKPRVRMPRELLKCRELVLDEKGQVLEVWRPIGSNTIGIVAWNMQFFTPEYPEGRNAIVIANDITFMIGSFGPAEDLLFYKASEMARSLGIPRIYISANSGARIGLADELKSLFRVAWNNPMDPHAGFKYLYLSPEDFHNLVENHSKPPPVIVERVHEDGEERFKIKDIIGVNDGIGVENLHGSGLIAGETSLAYEEIFTISLVTCRSVGIGAYLVRLGQRCIQNEGHPIILTGSAALNKLLGREVYTSNLQLGGTQIMYRNGVSHMTVRDDYHGILCIMRWMSFVPKTNQDHVPIWDSLQEADPIDRTVNFYPPRTNYDARWLINGKYENDQWLSGLFDRDTFMEALGGWAKNVVIGRARLGGIPVGVICVETRTTESFIPADPACIDSEEQSTLQAGQVWYHDSAFKTAQAINDFNYGERLPLIILANWRGFSGGQSDMFNQVLKYGSYIVDALRKYRQPVLIYIVPNGELRGGAWVVLDPALNPDMLEIYADEHSRANVLEPEGTIEIKYRRHDILETMYRLDPTYQHLKDTFTNGSLSGSSRQEVKLQIEKRESELFQVYQQIALSFADLHDTPGRMLAKNVIRDILSWRTSREYLYWRLSRRLFEERIIAQMKSRDVELTRADCFALLSSWSRETFALTPPVTDQQWVDWFKKFAHSPPISIEKHHFASLKSKLSLMYQSQPRRFMQALSEMLTQETKDKHHLALDRQEHRSST